MTSYSSAHYFLEGLNEIGLDYVFGNFGTDHAPLIEEMARWSRIGKKFPPVVICPHENVAMHMAVGYAMVTGRGQAVVVHVDAGTANAAMAAHNAMRTHVPVMLIAGKAPFTSHGELPGTRDNYVHFIQEPFDQASIVRPYVKWEYTLPSGVVAKEVLRRANSMMMTEPKAPVYLTLPREVLTHHWEESQVRTHAEASFGACQSAGTDPELVERMAARIESAERPTIFTSYAGRHPETVRLLGELAESAGIRVVDYNPLHVNIAHDHPCYCGFQPGPLVADTDLGILLDIDVPWVPRDAQPDASSYWMQIDIDPMKSELPLWPFPANLRVAGNSRRILEQLLQRLQATRDASFRAKAQARVARYAEQARLRNDKAAQLAAQAGERGAINPHFFCAALQKQIDADAIVVHEAVRNSPAVFSQLTRTRSGTLFGNGGGGLGFAGGVALGAKLADGARTVVAIVGDGSFYFNTPASIFATAQQCRLPFLMVVLDNLGWSAVKEATLRVYPDGEAKGLGDFHARLPQNMDFAKVAHSAGAYGECVEDPANVEAAIARCIDAMRNGQAALLRQSHVLVSSATRKWASSRCPFKCFHLRCDQADAVRAMTCFRMFGAVRARYSVFGRCMANALRNSH
jgi:acetolactate synthase-1/2/3 large subunit